MAKNKTKQGKGAKGGKTKTIFRSAPQGTNPTELVSALVNPFHPKAHQMKIPDSNAARTFTYQCKGRYSISSDTNGMGYHEFNPYLKGQHRYVSTSINTNFSLGGVPASVLQDASDLAALSAAGFRYRIVSIGVHVFSTQSPLDSQGEVIIRVLSRSDVINNGNVGKYSEETYRCAVKNCDLVIVPPSNGEVYQDFVEFTKTVDTVTEQAYQTIGITLSGCKPSVGILSAEIVVNCEVLSHVDEIGARLATEPAPHNPGALALVHNTRASMSTTSHRSNFLSSLRSTLVDVASAAGHAMLGHVGGAAVRGFGRLLGDNRIQPGYQIMDVD